LDAITCGVFPWIPGPQYSSSNWKKRWRDAS
jgi:hypothetical protein